MRVLVLTLFGAGVPLALFAAWMIFSNHQQNRAEYARLADHGQLAEAVAISRERVGGRTISLSGRYRRSIGYFVTYQFDRNSGSRGSISFDAALAGDAQDLDLTANKLTFRIPASREQYDAAEQAARVEIIFLPEDPNIVRILDPSGGFQRGSGIPWAILLVGLSGLSAVLFWQYKTTGRTM